MQCSRNPKDMTKHLQTIWPNIKRDFEEAFPGWLIKLTATHRPPELQFILFKKGRKLNIETNKWEIINTRKVVTHCDGASKKSQHNRYPSRAFDVAIRNPEKDYTWDTKLKQWQWLPQLARKYGIHNGGAWRTIKDFLHFSENNK